MKEIQLNRDMVVKVDDDLYDWLNQWKWYAKYNVSTKTYYAARTLNGRGGGKNQTIYMHLMILPHPDGAETDHKDTDTLNDQRENLRTASKSQQKFNSPKRSTNRSGYKGICWHKRDQHWRVQVRIMGRNIVKGFKNLEDAIKFRDELYAKYHKQFSRTE